MEQNSKPLAEIGLLEEIYETMRDIFALAASVVIAMFSLAFTPWTPRWWLCISIALLIAILSGADLIQPYIPRNRKDFADELPSIAPLIVLLIVLLIILPVYIFLRPDSNELVKQQFQRKVEQFETLGPLFKYYQEDQFGELVVNSYFVVSRSVIPELPSNIALPFGLFFNIESNVYVLSIYIPPISKKEAFSLLLRTIASTYRNNVNEFLKKIHLSEAPPGESGLA